MTDEAALISEAQGGSADAFTSLVVLHQARVRGYLARWVRDPSQVDDLAQEVFIAAFRGLGGYVGEAPFGAWLAGIARNQALVHLRTERRRHQRQGDLLAEAVEGWRVRSLESDSERLAERLAEVTALRGCLDGLSQTQRSLVDERYLAGRSCADIARDRDLGQSAVRMSLLRVRQTLRACLERQVGRLPDAGLQP